MSEKIICSQTGKEISGYDGEVTIDVQFSGQARYYIFKDIDLHFNDGKLDIDKSLQWEDFTECDIHEVFPKIDVKIQSPFLDNDSHTELSLKNTSCASEINNLKLLDPYVEWATSEDDMIYEIVDFNETTQISFYELWIPSIEGKYRGYMEINFKDIQTADDLLKAITNEALANFEWYQEAEGTVRGIFENNNVGSFPAIQKTTQVDYMDSYTLIQETGYLTRKGKYDDVLSLFENFPHKLDINMLDKEVESDEWMQNSGYKNFKDFVANEYNDEWSQDLKKFLNSL